MPKRIFIAGRSPLEFSLLEVREETEDGVTSEYLYIHKDSWDAFFDETADVNTVLSMCPYDQKTVFNLSDYLNVKNDAVINLKLLKLTEKEKNGIVDIKFRKGAVKRDEDDKKLEHNKRTFTREYFVPRPKIYSDDEILRHLQFNNEEASRICLSELKRSHKDAGLDIMFTVTPRPAGMEVVFATKN